MPRLLLLLFLFSASQILAQKSRPELSVFLISPDLLENAEEIYRKDRTEITVSNDKEATLNVHQIVTVLNEESDANEFIIYYDPDSPVKNISAGIYDQNGQLLRKMSAKKEVQDYSAVGSGSLYTDSRVKYFELNHSVYPFTVEVTYEQKISGMSYATFPDWGIQTDYYTAVESSEYILTLPKDLKIAVRKIGQKIEPETTENEKNIVHIYRAENLPALTPTRYDTDLFGQMKLTEFNPEKFTVDGYTGSMTSWQTFGKFIDELWTGRRELSAETQAEIKKITADAADDREKIDRLYQWMQSNMRYVSVQLGIGGWQPFAANYVKQNKYGDCKALTNYMQAMLETVGIDSDPALVYAGSRDIDYDENFASPRFNHVILHVPAENYWLECTSNYAPPNYLGDFTEGKTVMLFNENGGKLGKTPTPTAAENLSEHKIAVDLQPDGSAIIDVENKLHRSREGYWRYLSHEMSDADLRKHFQKNSGIPAFGFETFDVAPDPAAPVTDLNYRIKINRYGSKAGKRIFLPVNVISTYTSIPPQEKERESEIALDENRTDRDEITLSFPPGYTVESIPSQPISAESDFGKYELSLRKLGNKVVVTRFLELNAATLPADKYEEMRDFFKTVAKADNTKIVLVKTEKTVKP